MLTSVSHTNTDTQIHKYTDAAYLKVPEKNPTCGIFLRIVQGYQKLYSHESNMQIQNYKNTNTQIQHMHKFQKDPTRGIFLKRVLLKDSS